MVDNQVDMSGMGFEILVLGATGTPQEWGRALQTPASELPVLDAAQRESARRRGLPEQEYARGVLLEQLAERRWEERGRALAGVVREILRPLESEQRLIAVLAEIPSKRWTLRFETRGRLRDVHVAQDLAEDVLTYNAVEDREKLRAMLLRGLDREDLLAQK